MLAGLGATAPCSGRQTYSAWAPNRGAIVPKTASPTPNRVTAGPAASTCPAKSQPSTGNRGRSGPKWTRAYHGDPRRARASTTPTVAAWTRTRISSSPGSGLGTSATLATSGGPYRRLTAAITVFPSSGFSFGILEDLV